MTATRPVAPIPNPAYMPSDDPAYALGLALVGAGFRKQSPRLWTRRLKPTPTQTAIFTEVWIHRATGRVRIYESPGGSVELSFADAIQLAQRGDL